jgi:hypothetical protein
MLHIPEQTKYDGAKFGKYGGWRRGDSQRILLTKFLRFPGPMESGIVCMDDETTPNGFQM